MKYVVEIRKQGDHIEMWTDAGTFKHYITGVSPAVFDHMQELDGDYINQNFGHMQDESFRAGFELARRVMLRPPHYEYGLGYGELEKIFGTCSAVDILDIDPLVVKDQVEEYEAEKARAEAEAGTGKVDREDLDKAAAKAVETFRKLGANYVQIAQAVTKAMAEAVEAEA